MPLRGIIFDLDGTLADTLPVCIGAFQETVQHFTGQRPAADEISALFGPSEEGMLETLLPGQLEEAFPHYLVEYERLHEPCRQLFPGLERAFDLLKSKNLRLAIVSGKGQLSAEISLRFLGLRRWIDCVETGFAEKADKPYSIRKVLASWRIPPDEVAYLGDAPSDMQSARHAGVLPLGAAWSPTAPLRTEPDKGGAVIFYAVDAFIKWIDEI